MGEINPPYSVTSLEAFQSFMDLRTRPCEIQTDHKRWGCSIKLLLRGLSEKIKQTLPRSLSFQDSTSTAPYIIVCSLDVYVYNTILHD